MGMRSFTAATALLRNHRFAKLLERLDVPDWQLLITRRAQRSPESRYASDVEVTRTPRTGQCTGLRKCGLAFTVLIISAHRPADSARTERCTPPGTCVATRVHDPAYTNAADAEVPARKDRSLRIHRRSHELLDGPRTFAD